MNALHLFQAIATSCNGLYEQGESLKDFVVRDPDDNHLAIGGPVREGGAG